MLLGKQMNKFRIMECVKANKDGEEMTSPSDNYSGYVVAMACSADPGFVLFFPISTEHAKMMNFILADKKYDINTEILGIYKAMLDSWKSSDRFLSGIIMDTFYDKKAKDDLIMIRLALSDSSGEIDALVKVNFVHAVFLATMDSIEITISDDLLDKLVPQESIMCRHKHDHSKEDDRSPACHEDKKLLRIVKDIMSAGVKDDKGKEEKPDSDVKPDKPDKSDKSDKK